MLIGDSRCTMEANLALMTLQAVFVLSESLFLYQPISFVQCGRSPCNVQGTASFKFMEKNSAASIKPAL